MKKKNELKTLTIRGPEQRRAITSPLRMELLGLFVDRKQLSVAQLAERLGRPATALHYHVGILQKAGLLRRVGFNRSGRRPEALYLPVADAFMLETAKDDPKASAKAALKAMSTAFRMAERDLEAALANPASRQSGPGRSMFGARVHLRLSRKDLAEVNRHLRNIEKIITRVNKTHKPSPTDTFVSLTVALLPLRNREVKP